MKGKEEINIRVAFDFAESEIRAIAAEVREDNAIKIISEESKRVEDIKNGIIGQPTATAFNVSVLLKKLQNSSKTKTSIRKFSVAVGGKGMRVVEASVHRQLKGSKKITPDIIDTMAAGCEKSYQVANMLVYDTIPVMYELNGKETENPEGQYGTSIIGHYHLVVGYEQIKTQFKKCMERIYDCYIEYMPLAVEAFAIAVTEEEDRQAGCAVINMGASSTTLAIYRDEILQHLITVPLGGRNITKDIGEIGITEDHAEKLKCQKGIAMQELVERPVNFRIPARDPNNPPVIVENTFLAMIIESRLNEIFNPIFKVLLKYQEQIPKGIIISGGAAKLNQIDTYIYKKTGIPTYYGNHSGWLTPDTPERYEDLCYAQIIGTIVLYNDYKKENKDEKNKKQKSRKSIKDLFTQGIFKFFEEDTELERNTQK